MRALLIVVSIALLLAACAQAADMLALFPNSIAGAAISRPAQAYDAKTIYDYMDGAADPYLRFDFQQLYAAEYQLNGALAVVEVFDMGSSAEAYGMFSTVASGERLPIGQGAAYGDMMLYAWQGRFLIKIAGEEETKPFRDFATALAARFVDGIGASGPRPALLSFLPESALHPTGVRYFHTHADLNNAYYVSTEDVLLLAKGRTDVVFAGCELNGQPAKVVLVRYPDAQARAAAVARFSDIMFSKKATRAKGGAGLEEMRKGQFTGLLPFAGPAGEAMLALCFEARTASACTQVLDAIASPRAAQ
jgi:hypothetical protein